MGIKQKKPNLKKAQKLVYRKEKPKMKNNTRLKRKPNYKRKKQEINQD